VPARVSAEEVKEVIETSLTDDTVCSNMIDTANLLVDTHLGTTLSEQVLKKVELYLAAHFVALTEERGGITLSKMGDSSESYANVYTQGFNSTRFGQTALALDSTGVLTNVAQTQLKADFRVV
jgi:hypothetical protein